MVGPVLTDIFLNTMNVKCTFEKFNSDQGRLSGDRCKYIHMFHISGCKEHKLVANHCTTYTDNFFINLFPNLNPLIGGGHAYMSCIFKAIKKFITIKGKLHHLEVTSYSLRNRWYEVTFKNFMSFGGGMNVNFKTYKRPKL